MAMAMSGLRVKAEDSNRVKAGDSSQSQGSAILIHRELALQDLKYRRYKAAKRVCHLLGGIRGALPRQPYFSSLHKLARQQSYQVYLELMLVLNLCSFHHCFIPGNASSVGHHQVL